MAEKLMHAKEPISGSMGVIYAIVEGRRYKLTNAKAFEAKIEKTKKEISIMGTTRKGARSTGTKGTFTLSLYYLEDIFKELVQRYESTGEDIYFDLQVTNDDPLSPVGRRTVLYKDCNLNGATLSKLNIDNDVLEEELSGTFERSETVERFKILESMN